MEKKVGRAEKRAGRPEKSLGRDTKAAILEVAMELGARKGLGGFSLGDIGRAIGITPSAIYAHFPGKDDIVRALFERIGPGALFLELRKTEGFSEEALTDALLHVVKEWSGPINKRVFRLSLSTLFGDNSLKLDVRSLIRGAIAEALESFLKNPDLLKAAGIPLDTPRLFVLFEFIGPLLMARFFGSMIDEEAINEEFFERFTRWHLERFWKKG